MGLLVAEFLVILALIFDFVVAIIVPADVASITLVHVAIWVPITLGLATLAITFFRKTWGGNRR